MIVVDAVWEKRNLGISCQEITLTEDDDPASFLKFLSQSSSEYIVVKIPPGLSSIFLVIQDIGYKFIEVITSCYHPAELPKVTSQQSRIIQSVTCFPMDGADKNLLFTKISTGLFISDRISLDPFFSHDQANSRYIGWIEDELLKGSILFKLSYQEKAIGFFNLRMLSNDVCNASLGGIYPEYQNIGFGFCLNYYEIVEGIKMRSKKIYSSFSTNNKGAFSLHLAMSYILDEQFYVFIKHNSKA
jgi:hypothetical protein